MLWECRSYALEVQELCFGDARAMLLVSESNAFGCWEQCFWMLGAMLLASESNASGV